MRWKINGYVLRRAGGYRIICCTVKAISENTRNTDLTAEREVKEKMGQTCMLTGIILKVMPIGEYDKRITILTRERGKISAFVRGARRPKSAMQAATNLFCFGQFEAYEGQSSYTVIRAQIDRYFRELATDLTLTCYGCYFLEVADYFSQENVDCEDQLGLLYQTLKALGAPALDNRLVRCAYELKTLVYFGVYPNVFSCCRCGKKTDLHRFSLTERGVLCDGCGAEAAAKTLSAAALYTLRYIITSPIRSLYTFAVTESVLKEISGIIHRYMHIYTEREFKTLPFLPED